MVCVPVTIDVQVVSEAPLKVNFSEDAASPNNSQIVVGQDGYLNFKNLGQCVTVTMKFTSPDTFTKLYDATGRLTRDALSFSDDPTKQPTPVLPGSQNGHQFNTLPFYRSGDNSSIWFEYKNTDGCDHKNKYNMYGVYITNASGVNMEYDPIVSNGSSQGLGCAVRRTHQRRR